MIKILKQTPITAFGRDCMEQLVQDDEMHGREACDLCCYRGWNDYQEVGANCVEVHGCTLIANVYFLISELNQKQP